MPMTHFDLTSIPPEPPRLREPSKEDQFSLYCLSMMGTIFVSAICAGLIAHAFGAGERHTAFAAVMATIPGFFLGIVVYVVASVVGEHREGERFAREVEAYNAYDARRRAEGWTG